MLTRNLIAGLVLATTGGLGLITTVAAQEAPGEAEPRHRFAIGAGQWGSRSPLAGTPRDDAQTGFFPWISYENRWLSINPSELAVHAMRREHFTVEALVAPRWLRIDPEDSSLHDDLQRQASVDAGARLGVNAGPVMLSLTWLGDVSDRTHGQEVTAEAGYGMGLPGGGSIGFKAGARWRDADLGTWMYGVLPGEERADRPAYTVQQGFTPFTGVQVGYPIVGGLQGMMSAEVEYLNGRTAASPIIARRIVPSATFGLFYSFGVK